MSQTIQETTARLQARRNAVFEELLDAGARAIAKHGIDRVTVAAITGKSGTSRTTFYNYFGDIHGLCAELWLHHGTSWLDSNTNSIEPTNQSDLDIALLEILCASHRIPEVFEIVQRDCEDWWRSKFESRESSILATSWVLATNLGVAISKSITPETASAQQLIPLFKKLPLLSNDSVFLEDNTISLKIKGLSEDIDTTDDIATQLASATAAVVATSGVAAASISRVARKLRITSGSIYPKYKNVGDLINHAFHWSILRVVTNNSQSLKMDRLPGQQYGELVIGGLSPQRETWRNFRIEMHIEARVNLRLS